MGIERLKDDKTFTICVGHQLCLLGGPSFIWVKLLQLCKMARSLNENQSEFHFVPVFWMASEDHDIREISSVTLGGKDFVWHTSQQGAAGSLSVSGIEDVIRDIALSFPHLEGSGMLEVLRQSYQCNTLAQAYRRMIHLLAGHLGVVVVDGNDPMLKSMFLSTMWKEIESAFCSESMKLRIEEMKSWGHQNVVAPRDCCLFYLQPNYRSRIVRQSNHSFKTADGKQSWSKEEILAEAKSFPERFSPNVLLRPLYQESILPNVLYLAGPAELTYWLQLKDTFAAADVSFPLLHLRSGLTIIPPGLLKHMRKWNLSLPLLSESTDVVLNAIIRIDTDTLATEEEVIRRTWQTIMEKALAADVTLKASAEAELQRALNSIRSIEGKMIRAEKRKNDELSRAVIKLKDVLFPKGNYQERVEGLLHFEPVEIKLFETLMHHIDPWDSSMMVIGG
jgi:bacillithiol biosynthesis cysteine-adding enzyme BshC